jgi:hypothetical protein
MSIPFNAAPAEVDKLIADHMALSRDENDDPRWRERTVIDFTDCPHTSGTMVEVVNEYGIWGVIICNRCGRQSDRECPHTTCEWNDEGTLLRCLNCGVDGT